MRFLADANVAPGVVAWLRLRRLPNVIARLAHVLRTSGDLLMSGVVIVSVEDARHRVRTVAEPRRGKP